MKMRQDRKRFLQGMLAIVVMAVVVIITCM